MEEDAIYYRVNDSPCRNGMERDAPMAGPLWMPEKAQQITPPSLSPVLPVAARRLLPLIHRCCALGFFAPRFAERDNPLALEPESRAVLRHGSGNAVALLTGGGSGRVSLSFLTRLRCGGAILSCNQAVSRQPAWPPEVQGVTLEGAGPEPLWERHKRRVALLTNTIPEPLADDGEMVAFVNALEKTLFEWRVRTGVLIPLTPHEVEEARELSRAAREEAEEAGRVLGGSVGIEVAAVLRHLEKREAAAVSTPASGFWFWLWAFAVTAAALLVAGVARPFDPVFFGLVAGAFLFQKGMQTGAESLCGRWKAKSLQFRDAVALMMGPLSGLVVGVGLTGWAASRAAAFPLVEGSRLWQLGLLLLIPNFLLLLPVSFLNGGRFTDAILFCRNAWLKPASRVVAGLIVAAVAWRVQSPGLGFAALWIALFPLFEPRHEGLASRLRRVIPPEKFRAPATVAAVVSAVKEQHPRWRSPAQIIEAACRVYETMTARPPGRAVTGCLLALYGVALLSPVIPLALYLERCPLMEEWARIGTLQEMWNARPGTSPDLRESPPDQDSCR